MKRLLILASVSFLFSCDNTATKTPSTSATPTTPIIAVNFKEVKTLIDQKCTTCHTAVGRKPAEGISFDTLSDIASGSNKIKRSVVRRSMPPSGSLTDAEIKLISDWADQGGKTE